LWRDLTMVISMHPKQEVPRLTCLGREPNAGRGDHSNKELFEQRVNSYSEHEPDTE
jgi:hypothetical protein